MLSVVAYVLLIFLLDRMVNFQDGWFYSICSLGIFALFYLYALIRQHSFRRSFRAGTGMAKINGYFQYHYSRRYLLIFLNIMLHQTGHPFLSGLIYYYGAISLCLDAVLQSMVKADVKRLRDTIQPDSRIIVLQHSSCLKPGHPWTRISDLYLLPLIRTIQGYQSTGAYQRYIAVHDITALAAEDALAGHPVYLCIPRVFLDKLYCAPKLRRKIVIQSLYQNCELYLLAVSGPAKQIPDADNLPYPREKFQIFDLDTTDRNLISHMIKTIEIVSSESRKIADCFRPFQDIQTSDPGKQNAQTMIRTMLDTQQNDTEYFYSLLKLNEFMIHYRSLADYEAAGSTYLEGEAVALSLGTLVNGIKDDPQHDPSSVNNDKDFINAVKLLHTLATGHNERVPSQRASAYAREQICALRNRYIGHGTMTYSVSRELLIQFILVTGRLTELFFQSADSRQSDSAYPKWLLQDGHFYLLSGLYRSSNSCKYLDYATGHSISTGNPVTISLCPYQEDSDND